MLQLHDIVWQDKLIKEVETNLGTFSAETYLIAAGIGTSAVSPAADGGSPACSTRAISTAGMSRFRNTGV
jgi:glycine/D-amino acid oxidase-like deaminating enzyme